jgi:DNA-binding NarL/FixJ family response regulator
LESAKYYLALGVSGYGNALMHSVYFHSALETINLQMIWLHPQLTAQLVGSIAAKNDRNFLSLLSEREKEISRYLLEGKSNHEIGDILNITPRTVKAHASHIYHKLQVKDRLDFALRYK